MTISYMAERAPTPRAPILSGAMSASRAGLAEIRAEVEASGLLLLSDKTVPSLATLVAGEPIAGSWWGHARAHDIARVSFALDDDPDVTTAKLVAGKVTYVHRRLWPALIAVGASHAPWQTKGLGRSARSLLARCEREATLRTDELSRTMRKPGDVTRDLERRLLLHTDEVHTDSGAHAKVLESWDHFERRRRTRRGTSVEAAEHALEEALLAMCRGEAPPRLPWMTAR